MTTSGSFTSTTLALVLWWPMTIASRAALALVVLAAVLGCEDAPDEEQAAQPARRPQVLNPARGHALAHDVSNPNRMVFVDREKRLHRSVDGGQSWHMDTLSDEFIVDGVFSGTFVGSSLCLRRAAWTDYRGAWQTSCSCDDGRTWEDVRPLKLYSGRMQVRSLFIHQSRPNRIFAFFTDNPSHQLGREGVILAAVMPHTRIAHTDDHGETWVFSEGLHDVREIAVSDPNGISLDGMLFDADLNRKNDEAQPELYDMCHQGFEYPWERACFIKNRFYGAVNGFLWEYLDDSRSWRCKMPEDLCRQMPTPQATAP